MATVWARPTVTTQNRVKYWTPRHPGTVPALRETVPTSFNFFNSEVPATATYNQALTWTRAPNCFKCPPADFDPWRWVVRLYTRNLRPNANAQATTVLDTTWDASTAWFAGEAHMPGDRGQYLMTAAHNVVAFVKQVDNGGKVMSAMDAQRANVPCDAAFVVASWGSSVFTGWVDRVAVMGGYFDNLIDARSDAAALRIVNSNIPPEFYRGVAPRMLQLPAASVDIKYARPFVVAGYPGEVNTYPSLNGLYIGGARVEDVGNAGAVGNVPKPGATWDRWTETRVGMGGVIEVTRKVTVAAYGQRVGNLLDGTVEFNSFFAPTQPGMSGGPGVMFIPGPNGVQDGKPFVVGCFHASGTTSSFNNTGGGVALQVGADPTLLLLAVGAAPGLSWRNTLPLPDNATWYYVSR